MAGIYPYPDKPCKFCGTVFKPKSPNQRFHTPECKTKYAQVYGSMDVKLQYKRISGNWPKYLHRLVLQKKRKLLSVDMLLNLLEKQNGKCALTGVELTCNLELGNPCLTNASVDRIVCGSEGGLYVEDNIRLVCTIVNKMRQNLLDEDFINWCSLVVSGGK